MKNKNVKQPYTLVMPYAAGVFFIIYVLITAPRTAALTGDELYLIPNSNGYYTDLFMFAKEAALLCFVILGIMFFLGERIFPDKPQKGLPFYGGKSLLIFAGIYVLFAVLSAILSEHSNVAFWGIPTEYEGAAAHICYIAVFVLSLNYYKTEKSRDILYKCFFILCCLTGALTLFEFFSRTSFSVLLYGASDARKGIALTLGSSSVYGSLCVLLFPVSVFYAISENKPAKTILKGVVSGVIVFGAVVSASSAALLIVTGEFLMIFAMIVIKYKNKLLQSCKVFGCCLLTAAVLGLLGGGAFLNYLKSGILINSGTYSEESALFRLSGTDMDGNTLKLCSGGHELVIAVNGGTLSFNDENGNIIETSEDGGTVSFEAEAYKAVKISRRESVLIIDLGYSDTVEFDTEKDVFKYIGLNGYLEDTLSRTNFPELEGYFKLATGRGYIWLNTLPLIGDCIFMGKGAGSFSFYFPQNDIVGMLNTHGTAALLTDKPHSWYLQLAFSCGIPALVALIGMVGFVFLKSGRLFISETPHLMEASFLVAVTGYIAGGLVNDSAVSVSPLFWLMLGVSAACALKSKTQA